MIVGFDYWQVLSHYPEQLRPLINALEYGNVGVVVISAIGKNRLGTVAAEIEKLNYAFIDSENIYEVVFDNPKQSPKLKLAKCKELGVDVFFDDRDDVCRLLNQNGIMAMRVTRKDNSTYDLGAELK